MFEYWNGPGNYAQTYLLYIIYAEFLPFKMYYISKIVLIICITSLCISNIALAEILLDDYGLGISGQWKQNNWNPLRFVVRSINEPFQGKIIAQMDTGYTISMPLNLSYKDLKAGTLYLFLRDVSPQITLKLIDLKGNIVNSKSFIPETPKRIEDLVILVVTDAKDVLRYLTGNSIESKLPDKQGNIFVEYVNSFQNLPKQSIGYSSIDLIILNHLPLDRLQSSPDRQKALVDWIAAGGTLLISGGGSYQYINSGFIKELLPVELLELTERDSINTMKEKFGYNFENLQNFNLIKVKPESDSNIILKDNDIPLIVEKQFGNGRIIFMAFDYSVPPFANEPGSDNFWSWFVNNWAKSEIRKYLVYEPYLQHEKEIRDLLASNLSKRTPLIKFASIFLLIFIIIICSGNLILKRYTRNTKIIILLNFVIILFFTAFLLLSQKSWENDVLLKNFSLMYIYPEANRASINSYIALIGERATIESLKFNMPIFLRALSNNPELEFVQADYFKVDNIHIAPWAMNYFHSQTNIELDGTIQIKKEQGKFVISNNLPFELEDVCVIYKQKLGKIKKLEKFSQNTIEIREEFDDSIPPIFGRTELRQNFSKIVANEGILSYLNEVESPIFLGWINETLIDIESKNYVPSGETLVILRR